MPAKDMPAERPENLSSNISLPVVLIDMDQSGSEGDEELNETSVNAALAGYELLPSEPGADPNSDSESNVELSQHEQQQEEHHPESNEQPVVEAQVIGSSHGVAVSRLFENAIQEASSVHLTDRDFSIKHTSRLENLQMSPEHVDAIKSLMSKIVLPESSHPSWAANIPEDDWKKHLLSKIQNESRKS